MEVAGYGTAPLNRKDFGVFYLDTFTQSTEGYRWCNFDFLVDDPFKVVRFGKRSGSRTQSCDEPPARVAGEEIAGLPYTVPVEAGSAYRSAGGYSHK
jgi:hypothetical protein